jgi:hypothetical protein
MKNFLHLPQADEEFRNIRINLEHIICYYYDQASNAIVFEMYNEKNIQLNLHNIKPAKMMKKIDAFSKPYRLKILKSDVK